MTVVTVLTVVTVVTVVRVVTKNSVINFFPLKIAREKNLNSNCDKFKNSKTKMLTKLVTQIVTKLKKTQRLTKLEKSNCDKTQKFNL